MRVGMAMVVLALTCWLIQGVAAVGQDAGGFEALLEDIGGDEAAEAPGSEGMAVEDTLDELSIEPMEEAEEDMSTGEEEIVAAPMMDEEDFSLDELLQGDEEAATAPAEPAVEAVEPMVEEMVEPVEPVVEEMVEPVEPMVEEMAEFEPEAEEAGMDVMESLLPAGEMVEEPMMEEPGIAEEPGMMEEAGAPPAEAAEEASTATAEDAAALAAQEEVRRQALEIQGFKNMEAGYAALNMNDFETALKRFDEALTQLPERPATIAARERARWGQAEANYRIALDIYRSRGDMAKARQHAERALRIIPEHTAAVLLLRKIEKAEEYLARPVPVEKRAGFVEKKKSIKELLVEGKQYYDAEEYDAAELLFEKVLVEDEYNVDAMRYLKHIEQARFRINTKEREATVAGMVRSVRDAWNPPVREQVELPPEIISRAAVETETATQRLQKKMAQIMIPSIEFRSANITDVINFLVEASISGDPEGLGVNIILNLNIPGAEAAPSAPSATPEPFGGFPGMEGVDEFGGLFGELPTETPSAPSAGAPVRTITLNLRRISLLDAIKYITEVAGLKFRLEDNAVIITPAGVVSGRVVTKMYPVQPSIIDVIIEREETDVGDRTGEFIEMGGRATIKRGDVKEFFQKAGVPFPVGTSITYNQSISQLIVANTPENLDIFERILEQLNVIPNQVEIEARFVEVGENVLEELGFQWILTDNYEFLQKEGTGPLSSRERIQANADSDGLTKGLRSFSYDRTTASTDPASSVTRGLNQSNLGSILTIASVLTNPEVSMIIQALSQKGNADLLSAPRVTTRSGVNAVIQIVREIIYPTEFEVTQPTVQSQGDLVTPPTVTPGSFETRQIGVILNVTPVVSPDGYTIDLTMAPEVAELVDWIQYGSEITLETGAIGTRQSRTFRYNIPQPIFSSRNATTSILIWDGQTVVMGGLMREELVTVDDKIPLLGDIPLLGRLFQSKGQKSKKTNLLIFVTARLVDPAGKPIHKAEAMAMPGGGATTETVTP